MKECVHQGQEQQQQQSQFAKKEYEELNAETRCKAGTVHRFCGGLGCGLWVTIIITTTTAIEEYHE